MRIVKDAFAGTLESCDALVSVSPHEGLEIDITSSVMGQYGDQIRAVVEETLARLEVVDASVAVQDKGAYDFTLRARVQGACYRAADAKPDWSRL